MANLELSTLHWSYGANIGRGAVMPVHGMWWWHLKIQCFLAPSKSRSFLYLLLYPLTSLLIITLFSFAGCCSCQLYELYMLYRAYRARKSIRYACYSCQLRAALKWSFQQDSCYSSQWTNTLHPMCTHGPYLPKLIPSYTFLLEVLLQRLAAWSGGKS